MKRLLSLVTLPNCSDTDVKGCVGFYSWQSSGSFSILSPIAVSEGENTIPGMSSGGVGLPIVSHMAKGNYHADFVFVNQNGYDIDDLNLYRCYENGNRVCLGLPKLSNPNFYKNALYYILKNNIANPLNCK